MRESTIFGANYGNKIHGMELQDTLSRGKISLLTQAQPIIFVRRSHAATAGNL